MDSERYQWRGEDDPSRIDTAYVRFRAAGLQAHGSSVTHDYTLSWTLDVGDGWLTNHLRVRAVGKGWSRSLDLRRNDGTWHATADDFGRPELPEAGIGDNVDLHDAVDCDLGLCPVTNVMPIRRLGLHHADRAETPLAMAWVEVPSLRVLRSEQIYSAHNNGGQRQVTYSSQKRDFTADLSIDPEGMVLTYPGLASRVRADV